MTSVRRDADNLRPFFKEIRVGNPLLYSCLLYTSIRHTATITGNYTHSWSDYTLNLNLNGRLQSKVYYPGDADGNAPGYGIWNLNTRHTFDGFRNFVIEPGIGIDNIFNKKDNRPLNKNFRCV